ncbi:hypothetical protein [Paraburkholderia sp.]|uniref:hypothetical protein n=1 Tax=Paraburkholderia sp. TaxID=1926495 RepID=UPI0039E513D2
MATNETPVPDDELESLMAELEASTGVTAAPTPKAPPPPAPVEPVALVSDDELAGLEDLDAKTDEPLPVSEPAEGGAAIVIEAEDGSMMVLPGDPGAAADAGAASVDDELAALEAEIAGGEVAPPAVTPWETQVHAPSAPHVEPEPEPEPVAAPAAVAPAAVATPTGRREDGLIVAPKKSIEEEEVEAAAKAKKAAAALDYYIDVDKFKADMQVTETNLDDCMMQQASLRAYYGARAARAEAQASSIKARFEVREAKIYDEHRKSLVAAGEKVTEKAVENMVKMDPRWIAAKMLVIESESIAAVAKSCVVALADRKDMVVQLGADRREETKGQTRIMAAEADREALRNRAANAARVANG